MAIELDVDASLTHTAFYAKTWHLRVAAYFITVMALLCAVMGLLLLFDLVKPDNGKPGTEAGIAMTCLAFILGPLALLTWFNVLARSKPLLRICNEGLAVNVIGASSLDRVPFIPLMIRLAWTILSMQGFRKQIAWIPWESLHEVRVEGAPMMQRLIVDATIIYPKFDGEEVSARVGTQLVFLDAAFRDPLERIASTIEAFRDRPEAREMLPRLRE